MSTALHSHQTSQSDRPLETVLLLKSVFWNTPWSEWRHNSDPWHIKRKVLISGFLPYEFWLCQLDRFCWFRFSGFLPDIHRFSFQLKLSIGLSSCRLVTFFVCFALKPGRTDLPVSSIYYLFICTLSGLFFPSKTFMMIVLMSIFCMCS